MPAAPALSRPTRRSLLLSGAVLVPFGLAGCDREGDEGAETEVEAPPPRATVTVEELVASPSVVPQRRAFRGAWPVRATAERPLAMLFAHDLDGQRSVDACLSTSPGSVEIQLEETTTSTTADGTGETARVFASVPDGPRYRTTMHTSQNLRTWTSVPLDPAVHADLVAAGDGLILGLVERTVHPWDIADDGAVTALEPLVIPDDQRWSVRGVARRGDLIVVLLFVTMPDAARVPHIVRSTDGGGSWSAPHALGEKGSDVHPRSIHALAGAFVIIGDLEHSPDWADGETFWRPTAWSSTDGSDFSHEEIPLPTWGREGWTWRGKGELDAETPVDFLSISGGGAALDAEGTALHLCVYFQHDLRTATRSADGTWTTSSNWAGVGDVIEYGVSGPEGAVLRFPEKVVSAVHGEAPWGDIWERSELRSLAPPRGWWAARGQLSPLMAVMRWTVSTLPGEDDDQWTVNQEHGAVTVGLGQNSLDSAVDLPEGAVEWERVGVHALDAERTLLTGVEDEDGVRHFRAMVLIDGAWVPADGLESSQVQVESAVRRLSTIEGVHHFPVAAWVDRDDGTSCLVPTIFTSEDGLSWNELGRVDPAVYEGSEQAQGLQLHQLVEVDGTLIGIGAVLGEDDYYRAATVVLGEEPWTVRTLEQSLAGSHLTEAHRRGDEVVVGYWWDDVLEYGVLTAEGTVDTEGLLWISGEESHSVLDLGDGAMLSVGVARQTKDEREEVGTCLWGSRDAGANWTQMVLPGLAGRHLDVELLSDGEDAIIIAGDGARPYGYRIIAPKQQLLSADG